MAASSLVPAGLRQTDIILVSAERWLIERADQMIVLVDSSKFEGLSGQVVCRLEDTDTVVTDPTFTPTTPTCWERRESAYLSPESEVCT